MKYSLLFIPLLFSISARADILFVDTNFAEDEVNAAQRAADARGEKLIVIPDLSHISPEDLANIRAVQKLEQDYHRRETAAADDDKHKPMVEKPTDKQLLKDVGAIQDKYGFSTKDIEEKLSQTKDLHITTVLGSGHSAGIDVHGMLTRDSIKIAELKDILKKTQTAPDLRSVYILGCNSLGPGRAIVWEEWKKDFPGLEVYGFDVRSPLSNKSEAAVVERLLLNETDLRKEKDKKELLETTLKLVGKDNERLGIAVLVNNTYISSDKGRADCVTDLNAGCFNQLTAMDSLNEAAFSNYFNADKNVVKDLPSSFNDASDLRKYYQRVQSEFSACLDHCNGVHKLSKDIQAKLAEAGVSESGLPCPSDIIKLIDHQPVYQNFLRSYENLIGLSAGALKNDPAIQKIFNDTFVHPKSYQPRYMTESVKKIDDWLASPANKLSADDQQNLQGLLDSTVILTDYSKLRCIPSSWIDEQSRPAAPEC
jgi:hypothetical protein